ncbi:hypothetical protein [Modestobacter versicolor]|uniref:hypothetical protein n=1 Tax=Modestobacter versicolor TaxID=429133 RepID=UPI0034DDF503
MDDRPARISAARWVIALGRLSAALLACAAAWTLVAVVFVGSPRVLLVSGLLAGCATACRALVEAFAAHRRGAWQLLVVSTAVGVLAPWLTGPVSPLDVVPVVWQAVVLGLLLHPDSRDWVAGPGHPSGVSPGAPARSMPDDHDRPHDEVSRGAS